MKFSDLPLKPTPCVLRQFAVAWYGFCFAMAWRAFIHEHFVAGWGFAAVTLVGIIGLIKPAAIRWLFIGATVAAFPIGWVVTQLMLVIMFYFVLTPVALIFRWRGRDELRLRRKPNQSSFWIERGEPPKAEKYLKQF